MSDQLPALPPAKKGKVPGWVVVIVVLLAMFIFARIAVEVAGNF